MAGWLNVWVDNYEAQEDVLNCTLPSVWKRFVIHWKLKNHVNGHPNNWCHICSECGKDFLHSHTLVEHSEIVHPGNRKTTMWRLYKKVFQGKFFKSPCHDVLGSSHFNVSFCERNFREKGQLVKHLQKKHKTDENPLKDYAKIMPQKVIVLMQTYRMFYSIFAGLKLSL